jgi:hypothetical protein
MSSGIGICGGSGLSPHPQVPLSLCHTLRPLTEALQQLSFKNKNYLEGNSEYGTLGHQESLHLGWLSHCDWATGVRRGPGAVGIL